DVTARRLEVADDRHAAPDAFEVVDCPFDLCGMGDGQEMQYCIGGTTGGHDDRHRIFDGFARDDVARPHTPPHGVDQHARRFGCRCHLLVVFVGHGAGIRQAHAHGLECGTHGVGRIHAAA